MNGLWLMDIFSYFLSQIFSWYLGLFAIDVPIRCVYIQQMLRPTSQVKIRLNLFSFHSCIAIAANEI